MTESKKGGMTFSSGKLLALTNAACERSGDNRDESIVAIILSFVAIEAFLNESIERALDIVKRPSERVKIETAASILDEFEKRRAPTAIKLEMAHFILTGKALDKGKAPYQDFHLLNDIRNHLVHKKPEIIKTGASTGPHKLVKALAQCKVIASPPSGSLGSLWEDSVCVPEVAAWAHEVAIAMIKFIIGFYPREAQGPTGVELPVQLQIKRKLLKRVES